MIDLGECVGQMLQKPGHPNPSRLDKGAENGVQEAWKGQGRKELIAGSVSWSWSGSDFLWLRFSINIFITCLLSAYPNDQVLLDVSSNDVSFINPA